VNKEPRHFQKVVFVLTAALSLFFSPIANVARAANTSGNHFVEGEIIAQLDFDPKVNGYGFANYGNEAPRHWQGDLGADDLIRMFGPAAVCKSSSASREPRQR